MRKRTLFALVVAGSVGGMAVAAETIAYKYDAKGRLVRVEHSGTVNNNVVTSYAFDGADNRRNKAVTGAP